MASPLRRQLGLILAWFVFPVVPVVLEDTYFQFCASDLNSSAHFGLDPRDWGAYLWVVMLGPLLGYGFLAGATVDLPDDDAPSRRWWRRLTARRSVWVAIGPWWSSLTMAAVFYGFVVLISLFPSVTRPFPSRRRRPLTSEPGSILFSTCSRRRSAGCVSPFSSWRGLMAGSGPPGPPCAGLPGSAR